MPGCVPGAGVEVVDKVGLLLPLGPVEYLRVEIGDAVVFNLVELAHEVGSGGGSLL